MKPSKEIDIIAVVRQVFAKPKQLAAFVFVAAIIGVIVALNSPKSYKASVVLAPEVSSTSLSLSSGLADMASNFGIDLNSGKKGMDAIYPEIYPELFTSYDFIRSLFNVRIRTSKNDSVRTYYTHIVDEGKTPFWTYPMKWLAELRKKDKGNGKGKKDPFKLPREEAKICDGIMKSITCIIDKKTSVITLTVEDEDPLTAAIMADTLQHRLQTYITEYRTKKAKLDCEYYHKLYDEAKVKYSNIQNAYAAYCDTNQDLVLESFQAKRDELENNMQLAFNTMSQLRTQLQAAEAKVQERTPAFTILSEAKMPYKASSTPRSFIVLAFAFFGGIINVAWTLYTSNKKKKQTA